MSDPVTDGMNAERARRVPALEAKVKELTSALTDMRRQRDEAVEALDRARSALKLLEEARAASLSVIDCEQVASAALATHPPVSREGAETCPLCRQPIDSVQKSCPYSACPSGQYVKAAFGNLLTTRE